MEDFNWLKEDSTVRLSHSDRQLLGNLANRATSCRCCCNGGSSGGSIDPEVLETLQCINGTLNAQGELLQNMYRSLTSVNPTVIFAEYPELTDQGLIYHWTGGIINQSVNLMSIVFKGVIDTPNVPVFVTDKYNVPFPVLGVGGILPLMSIGLQLNVLFPVTYDDTSLQLFSPGTLGLINKKVNTNITKI